MSRQIARGTDGEMIVIGITGGIGTGKSTVTEHLKDRGFIVIDTDRMSHDITAKGSPLLPVIAETFGEDTVTADGELDRKRVAEIVFADPEKRLQLQSIVTERVISDSEEMIEELREEDPDRLVFFDAPLLFETRAHELVDVSWVVTADENVRIARVMARDGVPEKKVRERIVSQMPESEKIERADEVIDNSSGIWELYKKIDELTEKYLFCLTNGKS